MHTLTSNRPQHRLIFSLVLYKHALSDISPLLDSIQDLQLLCSAEEVRLFIYDGSFQYSQSNLHSQIRDFYPRLDFSYHLGPNIGYGASNNVNFSASSPDPEDIFIITNPDVSFSVTAITTLHEWISNSPNVSCAAPLITCPQGIQLTAKRNPTILSLLLGRLSFLQSFPILSAYMDNYLHRKHDYMSEYIHSTYLSGCFLLIPAQHYQIVGGFCPSYFLHLEDADICRRLAQHGSVLHAPIASIHHRWARGSHKSLAQTLHLLSSILIYHRIWRISLF